MRFARSRARWPTRCVDTLEQGHPFTTPFSVAGLFKPEWRFEASFSAGENKSVRFFFIQGYSLSHLLFLISQGRAGWRRISSELFKVMRKNTSSLNMRNPFPL